MILENRRIVRLFAFVGRFRICLLLEVVSNFGLEIVLGVV
jgi:hypothetical protein